MSDVEHDPFRGTQEAVEVAPEPEGDQREEVDVQESEDAVPEGTTKEILAWVGDDKDRAQKALDNEEARGDDGLKGLKRELKKLLDES